MARQMCLVRTLRRKLLLWRQSSTVVGALPTAASIAPEPCRVARSSTAAITVLSDAARAARGRPSAPRTFFAGACPGSLPGSAPGLPARLRAA